MEQFDLTKKYALAVSGGVDSMTMLHMFSSLSPRPNFSVVTVNHNIREQAQADCDFVENYCKQLNVKCYKAFVDVPKYVKEHKVSEETAARILRYEVLDNTDCDYVCLAHHTGDNAETVLMHILRGSGAKGAAGIRVQSGKYLRPLLDMTREQIEEYALKYNVPYVNDSTNDETKYTRNYIRKNILPQLKQLYPNAEQSIARFAENVAEDCDYLDSLADISQVEFGDDCARVPTTLLRQPKPVAARCLTKIFGRLGVYKDIERTHLDSVIDLASGVGGKQVNLPFGYIAVNDYGFVTIEQAQENQEIEFEVPFNVGKITTPLGMINVSKTATEGALRFDLNKLPKDAVLRSKRQGDVFTKFGGGTKTLKKYLIDKKVPQRQRNGLVLIASGNEVYVICGVEISDKVRVEENSDVCYIAISKYEVDK